MKDTIKAVLDEYYNVNLFSEIARIKVAEKIEEALSGKDKNTSNKSNINTTDTTTRKTIKTTESTAKKSTPVVATTVEKPATAKTTVVEKDDTRKTSKKTNDILKTGKVQSKKRDGLKGFGKKKANDGKKSKKRTRTRTRKNS